MTKEQHPITLPSPELRAKWRSEAPRNRDAGISREDYLMDRAAEWGANQELEAIMADLKAFLLPSDHVHQILLSRRPKPPRLKQQALCALLALIDGYCTRRGDPNDIDIIRQALEQLPND